MFDAKIKCEDVIEIAREAGNIAMQFYERKYSIKEKEDKTLVTDVDITIHHFLVKKLSMYDYPILSEEGNNNFEVTRGLKYGWIIDPLDGTSDFIAKSGEFSIMIGLVNSEGDSVFGIVYAPALDELYYAAVSAGAFLIKNKQKHLLKVSKRSLNHGRILVSRHHLGMWEQDVSKEYNMSKKSMGSAGIKIGRIALGEAELYINSSDRSGLWDICAADIILKESGGNIVDMNGNIIKYNEGEIMLSNGYIASNKYIHIKNS